MIRSRNEPPEVTSGKMQERWAAQRASIHGMLCLPHTLNANWQQVSAMIWAHCDGRVVGEWQDRPVPGWTAEHIQAPFDICMVQDPNAKTLQDADLALRMITTLLPDAALEIKKCKGRDGEWETLIDTRCAQVAKHRGMIWGFGPGIALATWRAYFSYLQKEPTYD
ncbi:hypothetical protein D869_gp170 [Caulobacter phage CcrRogue]|uniref:Uncharacterized protein n=1 Tax=Caulobacter phage CcrRogue TaxID=2927986 RepID=K4JND8_9CAUD|nr:hypothetical protein D869_gp170 [Caulobacter phage CcrRogue]AFU86744.1 hypothetical protein CcrRogue_gp262 [Caulobacter phage CcrRogue]